MSQNGDACAKRSPYRCLNHRALVEMQRKVVKRGKRNGVIRFILSKDDKDKITAWKQDLVRILQVFNVRSIGSAGNLQTYNPPLLDPAGDRYTHGGVRYPNDGCGYASEDVGGA